MAVGHGSGDDLEPVVAECGRAVVARVAPGELIVFDETAGEYFADPRAALGRAGREETLGFGLDLALWTPVVLAVAATVVQFLVTVAAEALAAESRQLLLAAVRRMLRRTPPGLESGPDADESPAQSPADRADAPGPGADRPGGVTPALTRAQALELRAVAVDRALAVGLGREQAELLADAFIAAIVTLP